MKIPEKIRIGGIDYPIEYVPDLNDGAMVCYGMIDTEQSRILLNTNQAYQRQCVTLWHEILHGIIDHAHVELDDEVEEKIVKMLSKGIYQVLQDNGKELFDNGCS
jgi:Zn-dependent peptidase ImmA (M78 family)